ncbi:hypothetical protein D3C87_101960 [compost metagenome]
MFKKLVVLVILTVSGMSAYASNSPKNVECFNDDTSFKIVNEGNPRNKATAKIADHQGSFPFGGAWLWLISSDGGYLNSQTKYKTMNGGTLTVSEQVLIGRGGCGRGSCDNNQKLISAYYISPSADEFIYDCNEISL